MRKMTYWLYRVNKNVTLKFNILLNYSNPKAGKKPQSTVSNNFFQGEYYGKISFLHPTLTIALSDDVRDESARTYSINRTAEFGRITLLRFIKEAKQFTKCFEEEKDLFVYEDGKLIVNKDLAKKNRVILHSEFNKNILLSPAVVRDEDSHAEYEGIIFMIHDPSNYAFFTYFEFCEMLEYLERLDFDVMALQLLQVSMIYLALDKEHHTQSLMTSVTDTNTPKINPNLGKVPEPKDSYVSKPVDVDNRIPNI